MADPRNEETAGSDEQDPVDFEAALAELEELVGRMEAGSMSLEESLAAFERGIKLTRECQSALKSAELRIKALTQDGDELELSSSGDERDAS
ncbi:MAG: exodeoxyribonuclease VII small subunit [Pseudomonadales bacterium]|nr:exodeoxyribonuclease VII small subunit [Pseudomonadales bacterium]